MNIEPSKFPKISNKLPRIKKQNNEGGGLLKKINNLNLDIEAIEESNN